MIFAGVINNNNIVTTPTRTKLPILLSKEKFNNLINTKKIKIVTHFNTKPNNKHIKIYSNYKIKLKITGDFNYQINK